MSETKLSNHIIPTSQDCGNIVQWEHINIDIPDTDITFYFYFQALGLTVDPYLPSQFYNRVYWANVGQQQFHLVRWNHAQVIQCGKLVLQVPCLDQLETRLVAAEPKLKGTCFQWKKEEQNKDKAIYVTCPWGNQYIVVESDRIPSNCGSFPLVSYPWQLGLCSLILSCAKDTSKKIAKFFRNVLFARVWETENSAIVCLGPRQSIVFEEDEARNLPECLPGRKEDPMYPDYHVCVYIADFQKAYQQVEALELLYNDHIFSDKIYSYQDALFHNQFRFRDIIDMDAHERGERRVLYQLQFETRSLYHPFYMRPLVNRMGQVGIYCFQ
ncbi:hypothetical protein Gasu2_46770 [Galdieria sulphuraria]|uniref:Uncharacterized protein n=1 Tax=Galdieria sulphuraria TaxID=130081 RepID=M2X5C6_GALSU|nr:uncharacterized protein Gasu_10740 [Galdieria sulphuraria]EME31695.1 hypothetical protein Gasu_10740 [Galdieria sulphuraria]GJD10489.1 hypothetical protein Gasu2_46770 [Galdieria sulphuraria]|eukprot:XP_005708215.1 hypothetical protein Gasu_10740 [Galdieria sulphuraria]